MKIVAVSYLNTVPFIYGIEHSEAEWLRQSLELAVPSACADSLLTGRADIALIPVAEIPNVKNARIITDYCISANGLVDTVALLSDTPLGEIKTIYLDNHSRTSVQLARVLARELWRIEPRWVDDLPENLKDGEAMVAIGDKVFEKQVKFSRKWDLAEEWKKLTGLPFVFAAWVARTEEGLTAAEELNRALKFGCQHIAESIPRERYDFNRSYRYLTENIQFGLDDTKRKAIELFLEKIKV